VQRASKSGEQNQDEGQHGIWKGYRDGPISSINSVRTEFLIGTPQGHRVKFLESAYRLRIEAVIRLQMRCKSETLFPLKRKDPRLTKSRSKDEFTSKTLASLLGERG
jgi:hypothetical protein